MEFHRPNLHFTPPSMWMNDPNGMVYYEGEYHLFYQHYPKETVWGPMHWGHAVSKDMVHWEHLPIAIFPDSLGLIFSGSAVVDWNNTSKLGQNGKPPLVAIFTQHSMEKEKAGHSNFQYQSLAYSNDNGRSWKMYAGNPIIPNTQKIRDFRDPKVSWDEDSKQWIMVFAAHDHIKIWGSPDLIHWSHLSDFGSQFGAHTGVWECPDLFPIYLESETTKSEVQSASNNQAPIKKWVLLQSLNPGGPNGGSATQYFVGNFDGINFKLDPAFENTVQNGKAQWLDWGKDNYAGVTWSDVPKKDGRRLFIGWMSNWEYATKVPTGNWRSAMTLPRSLHLKQTAAGLRLSSEPVQELEGLRKEKIELEPKTWKGDLELGKSLGAHAAGLELVLDLQLSNQVDAAFSIVLSNDLGENYQIGYRTAKNEFFSDRSKSGKNDFSDQFGTQTHVAQRRINSQHLQLHVFLDVASCELFADGGEIAMTEIYFPSANFNHIKLVSANGQTKLVAGTAYVLKAAR
ncbi:MAG: glycoside hydrolase family 32 protein [Saprospiraceae bacterium]|nr:glycoside hydrolase family 32 protein [Saprospiraceae bacterium]